MRWKRSLQLTDVHCEGEIGRIVTGGFLDIPGDTMVKKLEHINTVDDQLIRLLMREPRGIPASHIVLLTPPTCKEADVGLIILAATRASAMSGSNVMCATTALIETGIIEMHEPETEIVFDTAAGLVRAVASCRDGKCERVSLDMPPAFAVALAEEVDTKAWGKIYYDVAFGGVFCAIVDVNQIGLSIEEKNARQLAEAGIMLKHIIDENRTTQHPTIDSIKGVAYVMFRNEEADGATRTCTTLPPGRVDRSPCGTGSNAVMSIRFARGQSSIGVTHQTRSIIDGEFTSTLKSVSQIGKYISTQTTISGRCWIFALTQVGMDPSDPFPNGFRLTDTWGGA
ncbi:MAG: proline racemase [Rhodospirillales bacterium]|jgi:proline racemase|nr:proline racemase [Rhodospirillales bacterium]